MDSWAWYNSEQIDRGCWTCQIVGQRRLEEVADCSFGRAMRQDFAATETLAVSAVFVLHLVLRSLY